MWLSVSSITERHSLHMYEWRPVCVLKRKLFMQQLERNSHVGKVQKLLNALWGLWWSCRRNICLTKIVIFMLSCFLFLSKMYCRWTCLHQFYSYKCSHVYPGWIHFHVMDALIQFYEKKQTFQTSETWNFFKSMQKGMCSVLCEDNVTLKKPNNDCLVCCWSPAGPQGGIRPIKTRKFSIFKSRVDSIAQTFRNMHLIDLE